MCKLLIMTGITEGLVAEEFMKRMSTPMSRMNPHGIGYTGVGPDGELFSERWLNNNHFFDKKNIMTLEISEKLAPYLSRLPANSLDVNYSTIGTVDFTNVKTVTMHTRFATCSKEFANTHPFIDQDVSLIHNGSIRNAFTTHYSKGLDVNKISSCDSEAALQTYLTQGVAHDSKKAKEWLNTLSGSWAFGVLSRNSEGNRVLDVVRGISSLFYIEVEGLGKIFTTDEDDAKGIIKDMGLTYIKEPFFVKADEMHRYDAITGEYLEGVDVKPVYKTFGSNSKTGGAITTGTSGSMRNQSSQTHTTKKRNHQDLIDLVDAFRDDPDAMSLLPDIFTFNSHPKDLKIDFRKVKKHCNDATIPLVDRLDIFDLVFGSRYVPMYESFHEALREFIRLTDHTEGLKTVRGLIKQLWDKKQTDVA